MHGRIRLDPLVLSLEISIFPSLVPLLGGWFKLTISFHEQIVSEAKWSFKIEPILAVLA